MQLESADQPVPRRRGESANPNRPASRRRGADLEDAILQAAWEQLESRGYAAFTIESVAERARTSRPVLYRRWPTREQLLLATIRRRVQREAPNVPDTGSLRGDLVAMLSDANRRLAGLAASFSAHLGAYYAATGDSPRSIRRQLLGDRASAMDAVMRRAAERGEVDLDQLTPRLIALPFDLMRHELLMDLQLVSDQVIAEIVDDICLPLLTGGARRR